MRYLITGGAGFIGSNFIRFLFRERNDIDVINLDALSYAGNLDNLSEVMDNSKHTFIHGDICDPKTVAEAIKGVDVVVNLAAETHVDRSILDSSVFVRTNVEGVQVLLEACRQEGVTRFIQVSTDEVYGSLDEAGQFTEESPYAPNSPYAASKAAGDLLARSYHKTHGMDVIVTRCCNNYGAYQFPEKLIPLMILNAIEDKMLPVYGDGLNTRDWIHVEDHCRALDFIMAKGSWGSTYNIGSNQEKQNIDVVYQILEILNKPRDLVQFVADRPGHDRRYAIDATLLRGMGWAPQISFERGLVNTVEWYTKNMDWVEGVRDASYASYYQQMYEGRGNHE